MTRPSNEAEYLARMVPPSVRGVDRRTLLRGALGVGALLGARRPRRVQLRQHRQHRRARPAPSPAP